MKSAKVIDIPIRSVYPNASAEELNKNANHAYNLVNRVFYPPHDQQHDTKNITNPIIILWWCTETNGVTYPDGVIPLFPMKKNNEDLQSALISSIQGSVISQSKIIYNPFTARRRGTFILINATAINIEAKQTLKRIEHMKVSIIELIQSLAKDAHQNDIIEINTCTDELKQPPLIPFCDTVKIAAKEKLDLINTINFCEAIQSNSLVCIHAAKDRLARQSVYYHDFYYFVDNSSDSKTKTFTENSVVRVLSESRSLNSQIFVSSEQSVHEKGGFKSMGIVQVNYRSANNNRYTKVDYRSCEKYDYAKKTEESKTLDMFTSSKVISDQLNHLSTTTKVSDTSNTVMSKINILYGEHHPSKTIQQSTTSIQTISNTPANPIRINTNVRYENVTNSISTTANKKQQQQQQNFIQSILSQSAPSSTSSRRRNNSSSNTNFDFSGNFNRGSTGFHLGFK